MLIIEAERKRPVWADLWEFRELIYFFSWSHLLIRYKQTSIGLLWTLLRPLLVVAIFSLVFGRLAAFSHSLNFPYFLVVLAGLLPWQFFTTTVADCSECFLHHSNLISKIYFPRLILPLSSAIVGLVEFFVTLGLLFSSLIWYGIPISFSFLLLPLFIAMTFFFSLGMGLWLAVFNIKYRDFKYVIPFLLQMSLYASPIAFTSSLFKGPWKYVFGLNPLVGIIEGYRYAVFGDALGFDPLLFLESFLLTAVIFTSSIFYFNKFERRMVDIL